MKLNKIFSNYLWMLLFICVCTNSACKNNKRNESAITKLIEKYSQSKSDSLKLLCARFLKENMTDLTSEKLVFYNIQTSIEKDIHFDTVSNEQSLNQLLAKYNLTIKSIELPDSAVIDKTILEDNINKAINDWNKYPWSKNVPTDIFLNFLMSYKIYNDYPENWRNHFFLQYNDSISNHIAQYLSDTSNNYYKDPNELYYRILVDEVGKWFEYKTDFRKLGKAPSLTELLCIKQGDCLQWAYLNTYILRSLGIPATIDIVPLWGSKNSGHADEVFWDGNGKMRTPSGRSFEKACKVFRLSFKKQNIWKDSIQPLIGKDFFLLPNLEHNHWYDVTVEHTATTNIFYHLPDDIKNTHYAYICVFNYGRWEPVFYGKIDGSNNVLFKNMGCDMLYQVAVPKEDSYDLVGNFFMIDSSGVKHELPSNLSENIYMNLTKVNSGTGSYVKKDKQYELKILNKKGEWQLFAIENCIKDSAIIIKNVPANTFYKLLETIGNKQLERIFSYEKGYQKWW